MDDAPVLTVRLPSAATLPNAVRWSADDRLAVVGHGGVVHVHKPEASNICLDGRRMASPPLGRRYAARLAEPPGGGQSRVGGRFAARLAEAPGGGGARAIDWSPLGCAADGGCVLAAAGAACVSFFGAAALDEAGAADARNCSAFPCVGRLCDWRGGAGSAASAGGRKRTRDGDGDGDGGLASASAPSGARCVAWAPDAVGGCALLCVAGAGGASLWEWDLARHGGLAKRRTAAFSPHASGVWCTALAWGASSSQAAGGGAQGALLAVGGGGGGVALGRVRYGQRQSAAGGGAPAWEPLALLACGGAGAAVSSLCFCPLAAEAAARFALVAACGSALAAWPDGKAAEVTRRAAAHKHNVSGLAALEGGEVRSCGFDGAVRCWDAATLAPLAGPGRPADARSPAIGLCASPSGGICAEVAFVAPGDAADDAALRAPGTAPGTRQIARFGSSGPAPVTELALRCCAALAPPRAKPTAADGSDAGAYERALQELCVRAAARQPRPALLDARWLLEAAGAAAAQRILAAIEASAHARAQQTQQQQQQQQQQPADGGAGGKGEAEALAALRACNLLRRQLRHTVHQHLDDADSCSAQLANEAVLRRCWARDCLRAFRAADGATGAAASEHLSGNGSPLATGGAASERERTSAALLADWLDSTWTERGRRQEATGGAAATAAAAVARERCPVTGAAVGLDSAEVAECAPGFTLERCNRTMLLMDGGQRWLSCCGCSRKALDVGGGAAFGWQQPPQPHCPLCAGQMVVVADWSGV
jgi:hypothetical protein